MKKQSFFTVFLFFLFIFPKPSIGATVSLLPCQQEGNDMLVFISPNGTLSRADKKAEHGLILTKEDHMQCARHYFVLLKDGHAINPDHAMWNMLEHLKRSGIAALEELESGLTWKKIDAMAEDAHYEQAKRIAKNTLAKKKVSRRMIEYMEYHLRKSNRSKDVLRKDLGINEVDFYFFYGKHSELSM